MSARCSLSIRRAPRSSTIRPACSSIDINRKLVRRSALGLVHPAPRRRPHRSSHLARASRGRDRAVLLAGRAATTRAVARGAIQVGGPRRVDDPCRRRPPSESRGAARRTTASRSEQGVGGNSARTGSATRIRWTCRRAGSDLDALPGACDPMHDDAGRLLARLRRRSTATGSSTRRGLGALLGARHGYLTASSDPWPASRPPATAARLAGARDESSAMSTTSQDAADRRSWTDAPSIVGRGRDRDLDRDLDAAVERRETVRIGYGQVFDRGCMTADRIGSILRTAAGRITHDVPMCG